MPVFALHKELLKPRSGSTLHACCGESVLCCAVLCCAVLCCAVLCCAEGVLRRKQQAQTQNMVMLEAGVHQTSLLSVLMSSRPENAMLAKPAADPCTTQLVTLVNCRCQGERAEQFRLGVFTRGSAGGRDQDDRQAGGVGGHRPASCSPASGQAPGCQPLQGRQGPRHL